MRMFVSLASAVAVAVVTAISFAETTAQAATVTTIEATDSLLEVDCIGTSSPDCQGFILGGSPDPTSKGELSSTNAHHIRFDSTQALEALSVGSFQPPDKVPFFSVSFTNPEMFWTTDVLGNNVVASLTTAQLIAGEILTTSFLAGATKYLWFTWDEIAAQGTWDTTIAAVPIPAGFLPFLSGLAGIGFLGRYKAKRRQSAIA